MHVHSESLTFLRRYYHILFFKETIIDKAAFTLSSEPTFILKFGIPMAQPSPEVSAVIIDVKVVHGNADQIPYLAKYVGLHEFIQKEFFSAFLRYRNFKESLKTILLCRNFFEPLFSPEIETGTVTGSVVICPFA